jgi:hypothetical protein
MEGHFIQKYGFLNFLNLFGLSSEVKICMLEIGQYGLKQCGYKILKLEKVNLMLYL